MSVEILAKLLVSDPRSRYVGANDSIRYAVRPGMDLLERHRERRRCGTPTVSILSGPAGLAVRTWNAWSRANGLLPVVLFDFDEPALARAICDAVPEPRRRVAARLGSILGVDVRAMEQQLAGMTRYDAELFWRTVPGDLRIISSSRYMCGDAVCDPPISGLLELLHPALLVVAESQSLETILAFVERLLTEVPCAHLGIASAADRIAAYLDGVPTRRAALVREGLIAVPTLAAPAVVDHLTSAGVEPMPPTAAVERLCADGADRGLVQTFAEAAKSLRGTDADDARSHAERFLYERLESLPETAGQFRLNRPLEFRHGTRPAEVDLFAERWRLAVEVDGAYHHLTPEQYRRDRRKDWLLQQHGYCVLRFLADDVVCRLEEILDTILSAVAFRRETPFPSKKDDR